MIGRAAFIALWMAGTSLPMGSAAEAQDASPATKAVTAPQPYSTAQTPIGTLLDDPAAKAILLKYVPAIANNPQIAMARSITLKQVQSYAGDQLTDETLGKIDWDLSKLPPKP
ncbi:hypothetical protein KRR38_25990 [Novosphingobium sp. G106]|uniref:hypothetical protein n=1 Tax=Novosphingobium sp. G106 TaxID=2849500 RepID=UPI001C2DC520|nr:hypothetical protein [Novosphingobium sp. G106]MBV1691036.1 hypothetical protein [Novosphingobium sp. G106]